MTKMSFSPGPVALALIPLLGAGASAWASTEYHVIRKATDPTLDGLAQMLQSEDRRGDCRKVVLVKVTDKEPRRGRSDERLTADIIGESVRENVHSFASRAIHLESLRGEAVVPGAHRIERMLDRGYIGENAGVSRVRLQTRFLQTLRTGNLALYAGDAASESGEDGYVIAVYDILNNEALSLSMSDFTAEGGCPGLTRARR